MKIWLDDIRVPLEGFIWVHNQRELEELLRSNAEEIEVMSFDHDLGDGEMDGYAIIKWLFRVHGDRYPNEVRVHSANPTGAENIRAYDACARRHL